MTIATGQRLQLLQFQGELEYIVAENEVIGQLLLNQRLQRQRK